MSETAEPTLPPGSPASVNAAKKFGRGYLAYFKGSEDVIGAIAYGLYTEQLKKWLEEHQANHQVPPSDEAVNAYIDGLISDATVGAFRDKADKICQAVFDIRLAKEIEAGASTRYDVMIKSYLEQLGQKIESQDKFLGMKGWAGEIIKNAIATVLAASLVGAIYGGAIALARFCGWIISIW